MRFWGRAEHGQVWGVRGIMGFRLVAVSRAAGDMIAQGRGVSRGEQWRLVVFWRGWRYQHGLCKFRLHAAHGNLAVPFLKLDPD